MYRGSVIIFRITNILLLATMVAVWLSADSNGLLGGYTKSGLITYYVVGMFLNSFIFWNAGPNISEDIKNGNLAIKALSKPVSYYWQQFFEELGWHTISPLFSIFSTLIVAFFIRNYLQFPSFGTSTITSVFSVVLSSILFLNLSSCLGLLSFWITQTDAISSFVWMGVFLVGGQAIPVSFFPPTFKIIINLLPFRYIFSFPLEVYFNQLKPADLIFGLSVQIIWVVILGFIYIKLWRRGLKQYSAYGN